jgi:CRP/FNR family cyclic AMP-dependent transcriptional regulator
MPLNIYRLYQVRRLVGQVAKAVEGDLSLDWLVPAMSRKRFTAGEVLFRKGDSAHEVFIVVNGVLRIGELGATVGAGQFVGEIGVFSPDRRRTQTVSCDTDVEVLSMTDQKMYELYFQHPKLGFYLMRLIIARLLECMSEAGAVAAATTPNQSA